MEHEEEQVYYVDEVEQAKAEAIRQLETEERFQKFFAAYSSTSVKSFIMAYAQKKAYWVVHGKYYLEQKEEEDLRWSKKCLAAINQIKQKQLFDLQCQWRAGQIELPGVEICFDFHLLEKKIMTLDFLPPVDERDIEMYLNFLERNPDPAEAFLNGWQNYDSFRADYMNRRNAFTFPMPDWYEYHNAMTGNSVLMLLPDVRGEQERIYQRKFVEEWKETAKAVKPQPERDKLPLPAMHIDYPSHGEEHSFTRAFMAEFEPPEMLDFYPEILRAERNHIALERLEPMLDMCLEAVEPVLMEPAAEWQDSFWAAALNYRVKKIGEFLPTVLDEHRMMKELGMQGTPWDEKRVAVLQDIRDKMAERIIRGRVLCGEPGDLDYMGE